MSIPIVAALLLAEAVIIVNELTRLERERITMHIAAGANLFNHQVNQSSYRLARYIIIENVDDEGG